MATTARRLVVAAIVLTSCSGGGSSSDSQVPESTTTAALAAAEPPRVDLIDDAVSALERQLGGPQQYFEINATSDLVNLIVALNDRTLAQAWVYLDGELSSTEPAQASGFGFSSAALDFDPAAVLGKLQAELPESSPDLFFVEGGDAGIVRYSVAVTSRQGGQLVVVVGPDGTVLEVDPG